MDDKTFRTIIRAHFRAHGRHDLPWRTTDDPYRILVSEVMLQQTQVSRVIDKYQEFLAVFPSFRALSRATVSQVLHVWQGLGYNRRALMLQRCARVVVSEHGGRLPDTYETLRTLPGIGPYTAGALLAFAFNKPHPVIETNIRRVYIHHFFPRARAVADERILPVVQRTLDRRNPRRWYSALMDYGTALAARTDNPNRRSSQYTRQAAFEGSRRQLRGAILRSALSGTTLAPSSLARELKRPVAQVREVLAALSREGLIVLQ